MDSYRHEPFRSAGGLAIIRKLRSRTWRDSPHKVVPLAQSCDVLIVGAGPVGAVAAREFAESGLQCTVVDKRNHVAGNCYDEIDAAGVLIHKYGPHYFRTNDKAMIDYLGRFTEWIAGTYIVKSSVGNKLYPFPINLDTLELFFDKHLDAEGAEALLDSLRTTYDHEPANSEEFVLSRVGQRMYDSFYLGYTLKQWDKHPKDLAASVCGRIPIRYNRYDRYVDHTFQVLPKEGYTAMYQRMLAHPNITLQLGTDYFSIKDHIHPKLATLYCGPIDLYFDCRLGKLPWRSLEFEFRTYDQEYVQPCVQINYPEREIPHTRTVEIKHATGQKLARTTVLYEYPRSVGDPYYPIPAPEPHRLYLEYKTLAELETRMHKVYFAGRLAEYTYINMDQAIERGLSIAKTILETRHGAN